MRLSESALDSTVFIATSRSIATLAELDTDPFDLRNAVPPGAAVKLSTADPLLVAAAIRALDGVAAEVILCPPSEWNNPEVSIPIGASRCSPSTITLIRPPADKWADTRWVLLTSGTSGTPRKVAHTMSSLMPKTQTGLWAPHRTWGLLFDPTRMAGMQVLLHAIRARSSVVAPEASATLSDKVAVLATKGVNALSATPTLWRRILQLPTITDWPLEQVTLGGEIADQSTLDALRRRFPTARISHVFAATESGTVFSVSDGREGFPLRQLEGSAGRPKAEVRNSVLYVYNPGSSAAEEDGFVCTGDVVEIQGNRVFFRGRNTSVVNIGGQNIWPEVVEDILRSHPAVNEARVSAVASSMAGNLLVADVTTNTAIQPRELRAWVRNRTSSAHVPARVRIVEDLRTGPTGKIIR